MANKLFELFDQSTTSKRDLVSSSPKTLAQMTASGSADPEALQTQVDITNQVMPKVDYSDFSNFVFFNSALDYFNISGERMLNEWPYDGTYAQQLQFQSQSDGYQRHLMDIWPAWSGGMVFSSGTFVSASDLGYVSGSVVSSLLAPSGSTGMTVEFHTNIPSLSLPEFVVIRDVDVSGNTNYKVSIDSGYLSYSLGSNSGSFAVSSSGSWYMALVFDYNSGTVNFYGKPPQPSGWFDQFSPTPLMTRIASSTLPSGVSALSGSAKILVGSGSVGNEFGLSELRVWNVPHSDEQLFANYNSRVYQQDNLQLYWRFADGPIGTTVRDYSGHKIHGTVVPGSGSYYSISGSASFWSPYFISPDNVMMSPQTTGEYITDMRETSLFSFVSSTQASASIYDAQNPSIITNFVPFMYLYLEDEKNTKVLQNLLWILARQFDEIKVRIDQIPRLILPSYTGFNETPDALLSEVLKFWGFDTKANFLSEDAFRYFFGYDVLKSTEGNTYQAAVTDNQRLDFTLNDIKNEFWQRTLQELIYVYKKKGTAESVSSLLRIYGLDDKIVKLKEYGMKPDVRIQTSRIQSDKSCWVRDFSSMPDTETYVSSSASAIDLNGSAAVNMTVKFPAANLSLGEWNISTSYSLNQTVKHGSYSWISLISNNVGNTPSVSSSLWQRDEMLPYVSGGTIFTLASGALSETFSYAKGNVSSSYGLFMYNDVVFTPTTWSYGTGTFDGRWYSLAVQRNPSSVTMSLNWLDENTIAYSWSGSAALAGQLTGAFQLSVGSASLSGPGDFSVMNLQVWDLTQSLTEIQDHALNPFSFGATTPERAQRLELNWQFDKDGNEVYGVEFDQTVNRNHGQPWSGEYHRELFDYNFIAPVDYNWTEEKIRYVDNPRPPPDETWLDNNVVSLEFNLIDALNEDISLMLASMDNWNNTIGSPANRHRDSYPSLDRFRSQYFNRLYNRINFRAFADFLDFFDRSFVELVRKLLPARSNFKGAEFVVESHMLERPKVQYTYRRQNPELVPEGDILIYGYPPLDLKSCRIILTPPSSIIGPSGSVSVSATVQYYLPSTGSTDVIWSLNSLYGSYISSSGNVCTYYNASGTLGIDHITATAVQDARVTATAQVTVVSGYAPTSQSMTVVPTGTSIAAPGDYLYFSAFINMSDSSQVDVTMDPSTVWTVGDTNVAQVTAPGEINAIALGQTDIRAQLGAFINPVSESLISVEPAPGEIALVMNGNTNYVSGVSALSYLEAYPMWAGSNTSVYMSAASATPDPPKTGHAAMQYDSVTGLLSVESSGVGVTYNWDGSYMYPWESMLSFTPPYLWLMKGYALSSYAGVTTNDGNNWRLVQSTVDQFNVMLPVGDPPLTSGTNYYATTILYDTTDPSFPPLYYIDESQSKDFVVYVSVVGAGLSGSFSDLQSVYIVDQNTGQAANPLYFKKLNDSEILVWVPNSFTYVDVWPSSPTKCFLRYSGSLSGVRDSTGVFRVFTGV